MPRIPQGEFDTNPSTRVGAHTARMDPASAAMDGFGKAMGELTGAMATLQDQSERTEAYTAANQVKQDYLKKKAVYAAALESANGSGMADFFDPTDNNPDMTKRKRIQRPVSEMYQEMVESYEEAKKSAGNLPRGDIANDLMRQYVGDDLIQLELNTNKHLNRVRVKEVEQNIGENLELNLSAFSEVAGNPESSPEQIELAALHMNNKIRREIASVSNVLGTEKVGDVYKLLDRAYAQSANQILSTGVTNSTVLAAEKLVGKIKDPGQRSLAMTRLENTRRATGEVKAVTTLNTGKEMMQTIVNKPHLDNAEYLKVVKTVKDIRNVYIDPKYSNLKREDVDAQAAELMSTALAKRMLQENIDTNMQYLFENQSQEGNWNEALRKPSGETETISELDKLRQNLDNEISGSGIANLMGGNSELAASVREMTVEKMRTLHGTMKDSVADIVAAKYPSLTGREKIEKIHQVANMQGFGDPSLVGKKEQSEFKHAFMTSMAKDPSEALMYFHQKLSQAGDAYEGEGSYRRAMAMDLAGKDQSLAYLIPMADADMHTQFDMIRSAAAYKKVIDETDVTPTDMQATFEKMKHEVPALTNLMKSNPSMYDGIKQSIMHAAANHIQSKSDLNSAMKKGMESMKSIYASVGSEDGRSSFFAVNRPAKNYGQVSQTAIDRGLKRAATLPMMSHEEKVELLKRYNPQVIGRNDVGEWRKPPSPEMVDFYIERLATIEPDGRFPNMHILKMNGAPLSTKGKLIKMSAEDILKYGDEQAKINTTNSVWTRR